MLKEYSDRKGGRGDDTIKGTDLDSWKKETVEDLISETEKMKREREKIAKEREELLRGTVSEEPLKTGNASSSLTSGFVASVAIGDLKTGMSWNMDSLPVPVPTHRGGGSNPEPPTASSSSSSNRKERKEISMSLKTGAKVQVDKQWVVEDEDDEEDIVKEAMESVRKAVDGNQRLPGSCPSGKPIDPKTASKILPGAKSFQDIEKYIEAQKKEKMEQLKRKNKW